MKKYVLTIEIEFGSEHQKKRIAPVINIFKKTLLEMKDKHKKNKIWIREEFG